MIPHPGRVIHLDVDRRADRRDHAGLACARCGHRAAYHTRWPLPAVERIDSSSSGAVSRQPVRHRPPAAGHAVCRQRPVLRAADRSPVGDARLPRPVATGGVTVAEPGTTYTLPSPPCAQPSFSGRSGDGRRLSYRCLDPQGVMVVDSGDGHLIGTVPHAVTSPSPRRGGDHGVRRLVGPRRRRTPVFQRFDVATGALLADAGTPAGFNGSLWTYNPATGHLYAGSRGGNLVLDANTLQEVGRIPIPHPSLPYALMALDPDRPEAYIGWYGTNRQPTWCACPSSTPARLPRWGHSTSRSTASSSGWRSDRVRPVCPTWARWSTAAW